MTALKKGRRDISKTILKGILLSGVFVAVLAMSTTRVQITQYLGGEQEVEQTSQEDNESEKQDTLKSFEAITTSAQITLEHEFLLIDILPELIDDQVKVLATDQQSTTGGKVLKILFRQFISPNAP